MVANIFYPYRKRIAAFFLLLIVTETAAPLSAYALTGGPSQPEVQSFEPANTNQMVDLFTGDFVYNLPLLDVGGYPVNLSYHSGISMDQEASWVGLGWNINPGVINRNMRGLPDDFNGDEVVKEYNIKKNWTAGVDLAFNAEFAGFGLGAGTGIYYNNYRGVGFRASTSFAFAYSSGGAGGKNTAGLSPNVSLGLSFDSQEGVGVSPSLGMSTEADNIGIGASVGFNYGSREGFKGLTYGVSASTKTKEGVREREIDGQTITEKYKVDGASLGNGGSSISFASQSMTPSSGFPMENFAFTGKLKIGGEIPNAVLKLSGSIGGFYSEQKLASKKLTMPGYGYMYMDKANMSPSVLLDYNREKDLPFRIPNDKSGDEGSPVLSIPNYQYDLLSVNGQGIGGQYRAKRGDVGSVYDYLVNDQSASGTVNVDIGIGLYAAIGMDVNVTVINSTTSGWTQENDLADFLKFSGNNNSLYEPVYFTNIGEKTINDQSFYDAFGDTDPIRAKISGDFLNKKVVKRFERFKNGNKTNEITPTVNKKSVRDKRNQAITFLTADEAAAALDVDILDYPLNKYPITHCGTPNPDSILIHKIKRIAHSNNRKDHISEINVLNSDGKRYVYGIPAYNRFQREVTFSVSNGDPNTGLATYAPNADNTVDNGKGTENFFSAENIPDYAHSYLLTAVLSPDYVDLTGNGVSDDDLGDAVRINYSRVYGYGDTDADSLYHWRVPYRLNTANYQQGYKTMQGDNKASYLYGQKEIWYVNSIESKTMIAVFHLSPRNDGLGVLGENGGKKNNAKLAKLDSISLYSKADIQKNMDNAVPVKRVHFEYGYDLCPHIDNNTNSGDGKLTLKKVYFTYQKNTKGKLNPYEFTYDSFNPRYSIKFYDRWGNYQNNQEAGIIPSEKEYPYTVQNAAIADKNATAWTLKSIGLPTGGRINVELEADRYAYVQDKRAMQMYTILGFGKDSTITNPNSADNRLYTSNNYKDDNIHNRFVYVKVNEPVPSSGSHEYIRKRYMEGITNLFFSVAVKMPERSLAEAEYVSSYCNIKKYGLCQGHSNIIWIELEPESVNNSGSAVANPIAKAAWQFLRLNLPSLAYPGSSSLDDGNTSFMEVIKALVGPLFDIQNMLIGFNKSCISKQWCQVTDPSRSWIRLNNANYSKIGGGVRVKKITISDNWHESVTGEKSAEYGQVYDYTMLDEETGETISSGVAEYEPMIGNNENPFHQPLKYKQEAPMAPHNAFFIEYPIGETFFPAASVGYRQVKVTSYASAQTTAPEKQTGYTKHKFYTAYDFPVITDNTPPDENAFTYDRTPSVMKLLQMASEAYFKGTQGFKVELNDMHGKPRSEEVYANDGSIISSTEYTYHCENISHAQRHLTNKVLVMSPSGKRQLAQVGKEIEVMFDTRQQRTNIGGGGAIVQVDIDAFTVPFPVPIPIPTGFPSYSRDKTQFNTITATKVVRRYGILKQVIARQYGSVVTAENLVYDAETGDVLLTRTKNEFDDPIYNFTYPAHLVYEGMEPASKNAGAIFTGTSIVNGVVSPSSLEQYFTTGDEVLVIKKDGNKSKVWVITDPQATTAMANTPKRFIDKDGHSVSVSDVKLKIVRSGHRNMQGLPVASITSLSDPFISDSLNPVSATKIVNTSATEYSDQWKVNCEKITALECDSCQPIDCQCLNNTFGNAWRMRKVHVGYSEKIGIDACCLKHCYYPDGTLSQDTGNCKKPGQHFYSLTRDSILTSNRPYQAVIGTCTLTIVMNLHGFNAKKYRAASLYTMMTDTNVNVTCDLLESTGTAYAYVRDLLTDDTISVKATIDCDRTCRNICTNIDSNLVVNPYRLGLLGSWRPYKQWVYRDFRTPSTTSGTTIRDGGIFSNYDKFWIYNGTKRKFRLASPLADKYVTVTTTTKYNTKGAEIENKDAAGIYSSALYGYLQTQPVAVAKNARYKQIGFDGFEDYGFTTDCASPCKTEHFSFAEVLGTSGVISDTVAHTGNRSVKVSDTITMVRDIKTDNDLLPLAYTDSVYRLTANGCLPKFSPDTGRYLFSAWVKEAQPCYSSAYQNNQVTITFGGDTGHYTFTPSGNIIDGWQRIEGTFNVAASASQIYIQLKSLGGDIYFDDIRIQPFNSSMKTYVYDWRSLRLMAELDENNFATFYEYDDSGALIRIKKETERGIMTIQETRSSLRNL